MKHLITIADWSGEEILQLIQRAVDIKSNPQQYYQTLSHRTMVMMFEKPSLRTHLSFDVAINQLGGHAIYYNLATSPLAKQKESIADTAKVISRYADCIMARLYSHQALMEMARYATIPVINGLTNFSHPCQILSDLLTIFEKKGKNKGLKLVYLGDACNNVTHSLMYGCSAVGISMVVACPSPEQYCPHPAVLQHTSAVAQQNQSTIEICHSAKQAIAEADVVYTDSWFSYHISDDEKQQRIDALTPFQVNSSLMANANSNAIFMNCLPAARGFEQTAEVIDGPASVVFDQAENRLHMQKSILVTLLTS